MKRKHIGSSFDDFLKEEGIYKEVTGHAIKRVIASQLAKAMKAEKISKAEMARRLKNSRTQFARFLDPENCSVQLDTMLKAAAIASLKTVLVPQLPVVRRFDQLSDETHHEFGNAMKELAK